MARGIEVVETDAGRRLRIGEGEEQQGRWAYDQILDGVPVLSVSDDADSVRAETVGQWADFMRLPVAESQELWAGAMTAVALRDSGYADGDIFRYLEGAGTSPTAVAAVLERIGEDALPAPWRTYDRDTPIAALPETVREQVRRFVEATAALVGEVGAREVAVDMVLEGRVGELAYYARTMSGACALDCIVWSGGLVEALTPSRVEAPRR